MPKNALRPALVDISKSLYFEWNSGLEVRVVPVDDADDECTCVVTKASTFSFSNHNHKSSRIARDFVNVVGILKSHALYLLVTKQVRNNNLLWVANVRTPSNNDTSHHFVSYPISSRTVVETVVSSVCPSSEDFDRLSIVRSETIAESVLDRWTSSSL